ncbi:MAG: tyrosine-type recombinase/integrase [Planctomycetes bacterium]|nr:tyrosine-type recombinase/integrase [Planctomycetota bacterium]
MTTVKQRLRSAKADALTDPEVQMMITTCRDWMDLAVVAVPRYTGMRIGEVQHLRGSWINWGKMIIDIPSRQLCGCYECRKWRNGIWTPKTDSGIRGLLIIPEMEGVLKEMGEGINRSRQALEQRFERIRQRSGLLKPAYPHCLRATFAIGLAEAGMSAPALTYVMGWSSLRPAEYYIQSSMKRAHEEQKNILERV